MDAPALDGQQTKSAEEARRYFKHQAEVGEDTIKWL